MLIQSFATRPKLLMDARSPESRTDSFLFFREGAICGKIISGHFFFSFFCVRAIIVMHSHASTTADTKFAAVQLGRRLRLATLAGPG